MRPIPTIAASQCGVFSTAQALAAGWTRSALHHAIRQGRLRRVRTGAYEVLDLGPVARGGSEVEQARWRHAAPGIAAALTTGARASHSTAAVLAGIPLLFLPARACVCVEPWWTGRIGSVHLHRCTLPHRAPVALQSTTPERTVIDLAREHGVVSGVAAADYVLHERIRTLDELQSELNSCGHWPGVRAAREAIALSDGRSESVLETRSRLALRACGLPAPEPQARIGNQSGHFVGRVDFYWDEFGVVGEADGDVKYGGTDPEPLINEKRRQAALEDLDLPVVRWGWSDLHQFEPVAARLRRAFARAARIPRDHRRWVVLPPL